MSATIKYKGNAIASITTDSSKTLKTSGKYCEGDIVVENACCLYICATKTTASRAPMTFIRTAAQS